MTHRLTLAALLLAPLAAQCAAPQRLPTHADVAYGPSPHQLNSSLLH